MSYIGRNNTYGLFEKDRITIVATQLDYSLSFKVGDASSLLVISNGLVLEPNVAYNITIGGQTLTFNSGYLPAVGANVYAIYLGKQLSVPRTAGIEPILQSFLGDSFTTDFTVTNPAIPTISLNVVNTSSLIVFKNGVQQIANTDFTLVVVGSTKVIRFTAPPAAGAHIEVYVHGVERFDAFVLEPNTVQEIHLVDGAVTNNKLAAGAVTNQKIANDSIGGEKLNSTWTSYSGSITTQAFNGMTISSPNYITADFKYRDSKSVELKLDMLLTLAGTVSDIIRIALPPVGNMKDEVCVGAVTLSTTTLDEVGIIKWGGAGYIDIKRNNGINYTADTWRLKIRTNCEIL